MLFNSLEFLVFLPLVFLAYWFLLNKNLKLQNLFIVIVSYIFYGWWSPSFLVLIFVTTLCSFLSGLVVQSSNNQQVKKWVTIGNVLLNLGILGVYKYANFFIENFQYLLNSIGVHSNVSSLNLILPVGISFYTFQALSYTIDVYRKDITATTDVVSFFAYISFFPQLVAGPIERASNIIPQFQKKRMFVYTDAVQGIRQMLWGFFKKVVIADNCAPLVNQIFENYYNQSSSTLLLGAFYFTMQIYGDFSGYSDIALGTAKLFGIKLMKNFSFPYFSRNISDFWRRWHISLMTWFRDYIYFPLGGSRVSKGKVIRNTFIVFGISGLWHGANWTFIVWGLYHAFLFLPKLLKVKKSSDKSELWEVKDVFSMLLTFFLVLIGWIIFRADNLSMATGYLYRMLSLTAFDSLYYFSLTDVKILSFILLMLIAEWYFKNEDFALSIPKGKAIDKYIKYRWPIYYFFMVLIYFFAGSQSQFIYFQF